MAKPWHDKAFWLVYHVQVGVLFQMNGHYTLLTTTEQNATNLKWFDLQHRNTIIVWVRQMKTPEKVFWWKGSLD